MTKILINQNEVTLDEHGFLANQSQWNLAFAAYIAGEESVELTEDHLKIIYALQRFYQDYAQAPTMRPFVKLARQATGKPDLSSMGLMQMFTENAARVACRIAGLPKPHFCF